jgi:hypothetical protein
MSDAFQVFHRGPDAAVCESGAEAEVAYRELPDKCFRIGNSEIILASSVAGTPLR